MQALEPDSMPVSRPSAQPAGARERAPLRDRPWVEWLTRRAAIADARAHEPARAARRVLIRRGGDAARAAARLLEPPDGGSAQPALALGLHREACRFLLSAARAGTAEQPLADLLSGAGTALPPLGVQPPAPEVARDLGGEGIAAFAELPDEEQLARGRAVQRFVFELLEPLELDDGLLYRLRLQRAVRIGAACIALAALAVGVAQAAELALRGPDLARGKPWRTSSVLDVCHPERRWCAGARTAIFFCTKEDNPPWFELDLESVQRISRVEVTNRSDFGPERAVPLLVEVSTDGQKYWPVARRRTTFDRWTATFAPRQARYVRLTVERPSILHLERVAVRR